IAHYHFCKHDRQPGESVMTYVAALCRLTEHCEYGNILDDMLRDWLVCGITNDRTQRRLFAEGANMDFQKAFDTAVSMETAAKNAEELKSEGQPAVSPLHVLQSEGWASQYGGMHVPHTCWFKQEVCHSCKKKGHTQRMCQAEKWKKPFKSQMPAKSAYHMDDFEKEEDGGHTNKTEDHEHMALLRASQPKEKPYLCTPQVEGIDLTMETDTGASVSVVGKTYKRLGRPKLKATKTVLRTYTGEPKVLGEAQVGGELSRTSRYGTTLYCFGDGPSLLGRNWLNKIFWKEIKHVTTALTKSSEIAGQFPTVFQEGMGTLRGIKAKIYVDSQVPSKFFKARVVPFLKKEVQSELERLQEEGIISPVQFSDWVAPIVPVRKPNEEIRRWGDYKLTVNQAARLPRNGMFAVLSRSKTFTKLDLPQAYTQIELDKESRKFVTVNTKGLFQYNRLPYGVASAPAIFQCVMDSLLQGIPKVVVHLDGILITGDSEEEHAKNLQEVLKRLASAGLRLKREKCKSGVSSVVYLGHKTNATGLHPIPEKVRAIVEAPNPKNVSKLKSFLGMLHYYAKFMPNLSTVMAPLCQLLAKNTKWKRGRDQQQIYEESKRLLVHYDPEK
uniref:ribonuclease H n=1 Tax=Latimeria chalumnae TaxID=7897 RepID=H3BC74_LATCH